MSDVAVFVHSVTLDIIALALVLSFCQGQLSADVLVKLLPIMLYPTAKPVLKGRNEH